MKYITHDIVFQEFPSETSLAISISGCPVHCPDCNSKWLWEDKGETLDELSLDRLIERSPGITCVGFMGGDQNPAYINALAEYVKTKYPKLKVGWYSGRDDLDVYSKKTELKNFDYIKLGRFDINFGPLNEPTTNQRLYRIDHEDIGNKLVNITKEFTSNDVI